MPTHLGARGHPDVATDSHRVPHHPGVFSEHQVTGKNDDVAIDGTIDHEVRKPCRMAGVSLSRQGEERPADNTYCEEDQSLLRHGEILRHRRAVATTPASPSRPITPAEARTAGSMAAVAAATQVEVAPYQSETPPRAADQPWVDQPGN